MNRDDNNEINVLRDGENAWLNNFLTYEYFYKKIYFKKLFKFEILNSSRILKKFKILPFFNSQIILKLI